ncbi:MAG: hypothetical protein JW862_11725 [Anaerolineales bacterium]|nr:hypothetical protein [Anaerolineales bacterium]
MSVPSQPPGSILLFGSGETSASGQRIFDQLLSQREPALQVAILETPAGFELNSAQVAGRVADFLEHRLQNYRPRVQVIPARRQGTPFSPQDPQRVDPLLDADLIFMGPGSPSYAVRQLRDSLAWHYLLARHRLGADLAFASAAVVAISTWALPVYEIYKVGEDLHWKPGLDLFGAFGLALTLIPHWNNQDGGEELDTSRCFMGQSRFAALLEMLPAGQTVVGIDEHSAVWFDFEAAICRVLGRGGVTLLQDGQPDFFASGEQFPLSILGDSTWPPPGHGLPQQAWQAALERQAQIRTVTETPPAVVLDLLSQRQAARAARDWARADQLRAALLAHGWLVLDTPEGPQLQRKPKE